MDNQLYQLLVSTTKFSDRTKLIVKQVLVHNRTCSDVASEYDVSRQFVSSRVRRVREIEESFFQSANQYNVFLLKKSSDSEADD